jgi:hypothetical protein
MVKKIRATTLSYMRNFRIWPLFEIKQQTFSWSTNNLWTFWTSIALCTIAITVFELKKSQIERGGGVGGGVKTLIFLYFLSNFHPILRRKFKKVKCRSSPFLTPFMSKIITLCMFLKVIILRNVTKLTINNYIHPFWHIWAFCFLCVLLISKNITEHSYQVCLNWPIGFREED